MNGPLDQYLYPGVFAAVFAAFSALILGKQKNIRDETDFSVAGRSLTAAQVSWVIIGTLVGGVSTIGTVQAAYDHGVSAWIFTLGSGISCFFLGCFFAGALRREEAITVSQFLGRYFGRTFLYYSSFFNSLGMFIHIIAQYLAAMAILESVFGFSQGISILVTMGLLALFVLSGGIAGAGMVGKIKFFMLYGIMLLSAGLALQKAGGWGRIIAGLPGHGNFLNFFSPGTGPVLTDMGAMITGVLSTQIYLQAVFSARTVKQARNGAFLSALIIPPVGLMGIIVGLYLRAFHPELEGISAQALPCFFNLMFPPSMAALCSAVILLVILGTGAGLVLGVSTNVYMDGIRMLFNQKQTGSLAGARLCTLAVLALSGAIVFTGLDRAILQWSYMSMGLRGASIFLGLSLAVFLGKRQWPMPLKGFLFLFPLLYLIWETAG